MARPPTPMDENASEKGWDENNGQGHRHGLSEEREREADPKADPIRQGSGDQRPTRGRDAEPHPVTAAHAETTVETTGDVVDPEDRVRNETRCCARVRDHENQESGSEGGGPTFSRIDRREARRGRHRRQTSPRERRQQRRNHSEAEPRL